MKTLTQNYVGVVSVCLFCGLWNSGIVKNEKKNERKFVVIIKITFRLIEQFVTELIHF